MTTVTNRTFDILSNDVKSQIVNSFLKSNRFFSKNLSRKTIDFVNDPSTIALFHKSLLPSVGFQKLTINKTAFIDRDNIDSCNIAYVKQAAQIIQKVLPKNWLNQSVQQIDILLIPTNARKSIDIVENGTITSDNINSGWCTHDYENPEKAWIVVYRQEEMSKVIIHELIHALVNHFVDQSDPLIKLSGVIHDVNNDPIVINANEAIVETFACMIHSMFTKSKEEDVRFVISQAKTLIRICQTHSVDSSVCSYHIGRAALLSKYSVKELIDIISKSSSLMLRTLVFYT